MLIDCPGCARSYHVSSADLGSRGRTVICPRCGTRWFQDAGGTIGRDRVGPGVANARPDSRLDELPAPARAPFPAPGPMIAACAAACLCFALVGLHLGRVAVVAHVPRAAGLYASVGLPVNVVGLAFAKVRPERLASNDVTIRGTLHNTAGRRVDIPRIAFEVRDAAGAALVAWSETMPAHTLAAGRLLDFASQPHNLPAESRTVLVRFD